MNADYDGLSVREFLELINDDIDNFDILTEWSPENKETFRILLEELKNPDAGDTTRDVGDRLERLVEFIIDKSYFFETYKNVRTVTNEIDEVIIFSDRGKQALSRLKLNRELVPIDTDLLLGECKNYKEPLGVTYVGKFYGLMTVSGVSFGIIFTQHGLTGKSSGYKDAYGLTKILKIIEDAKNREQPFYILTFTLEDYEKMLKGTSFFELIKAKKLELQLAADYRDFFKDEEHPASGRIKGIIEEVKAK